MRVTGSIAERLADAVARIPVDASAEAARLAFFHAKRALFTELADDPDADLGELYQRSLQLDIQLGADHHELISSKTTRDSSGAYYTPRALAAEVTRHSMDRLIFERTGISSYSHGTASSTERRRVESALSGITIADLSCGAGDFLIAAVEYIRDLTDLKSEHFPRLHGVDVDPIALTIAGAELARRGVAEFTLTLGNPLLSAEEFASDARKVDLFGVGRIYAREMAIDPSQEFPAAEFDLILGNPPWEKVRFEERKTRALLGDSRRSADLLETLRSDYAHARALIAANPALGRMPRGEANTYTLFPLLGAGLLAPSGVMALILKTAIATSPVNSELFSWLRTEGGLRELHLFENSGRIFAIDSREKFCVALFTSTTSDDLVLSVGNTSIAPLDEGDTVTVSDAELWEMYPSSGTLPNVTTTAELHELRDVCARLPRFAERHPTAKFGRIVHLTTHAKSITHEATADSLAILEGKFIDAYSVRGATFDGIPPLQRYAPKARARRLSYAERGDAGAQARYFIPEEDWRALSRGFDRPYMLCWRSLTSATNSRTTIAAIAPFGPGIQSVQFLQVPDTGELIYLLGLFNSMAFDHLVRRMIPGIDLTQSVIRQIPVPEAATLDRRVPFAGSTASIAEHIRSRVERLLAHEPESAALVGGVRALSEAESSSIRREIDDLFFLAYEFDAATAEGIRSHFDHGTAASTP